MWIDACTVVYVQTYVAISYASMLLHHDVDGLIHWFLTMTYINHKPYISHRPISVTVVSGLMSMQGILGKTYSRGSPTTGPGAVPAGLQLVNTVPPRAQNWIQMRKQAASMTGGAWMSRRLLADRPPHQARQPTPRRPQFSHNPLFEVVNINRFDDVAVLV